MKEVSEEQRNVDFPNVTLLLPEPKRLWVEALRSGRYQQGTSMLAKDSGDGMKFCCLGVLCEVAIEAGVDLSRVERKNEFSGDDVRQLSYDSCTVMPPAKVWEWAWGTEVGVGQVVISEPENGDGTDEVLRVRDLASLNDDYRWTFEQIADAIEGSL